jgi:uncharacterized protein YabN with tetrapyrrole methylase and pyrophosphatase domain
MQRLIKLARRLRAPGGCPWDRSQDFRSFKSCVLDEVQEIAQAIEAGDFDNLAEEIGDTLWNMAFLVVLAEEERRFDLEKVLKRVHEKMISRHPHVFGDVKAVTPEEALAVFTRQKQSETKRSSIEKRP